MFFTRYPNLVVSAILIFFFTISLSVSSQESTIMDEQAHIPAGYTYVRYGDMRLNPEHPPLLKDLAGLPLLFLGPTFPTDDPAWTNGINEQWQLGDKLLHNFGNDADAITYWSRVPILFIAILLGILIYIWTRQLAGTAAGLLALTLYAFDPNIIAHNHYVTTDLGIAAAIFSSTFFFIRFLKQPSAKNILLAGLFLGIAQLTKFSAVLLFPLFGLITLIYALAYTPRPDEYYTSTPRMRRLLVVLEYLWEYAAVVIISFAAIWILYFFNTMNMPGEKIRAISDSVFTANNAAAHIARGTVDWMSASPILKPLGEYFLGVFMVFARVAGGNTYYFLGTVSNHATPWYFPTAFILKETLPFLFLIIASMVYAGIRAYQTLSRASLPIPQVLSAFIEERIAQVTMVGFILLYSYLSITGNLNIGFRHLFPMLPFIYVLVAKITVDAFHRIHEHAPHTPTAQTVTRSLVTLFTFWIVAIPILTYPSYLSYYNEIAGGHKNGYQYITDSNYDWGQDLKRLKHWVSTYNQCVGSNFTLPSPKECSSLTSNGSFPTAAPIDSIAIDYFGGSNPKYYFGDMFKSYHADLAPEAGWYAVSAGFFQESVNKTPEDGKGNYRWLAQHPMIGRAGDSLFIFYVPELPQIKN